MAVKFDLTQTTVRTPDYTFYHNSKLKVAVEKAKEAFRQQVRDPQKHAQFLARKLKDADVVIFPQNTPEDLVAVIIQAGRLEVFFPPEEGAPEDFRAAMTPAGFSVVNRHFREQGLPALTLKTREFTCSCKKTILPTAEMPTVHHNTITKPEN
jgi:hypothetical protein